MDPDLQAFRRAIQLRDRCRNAAVADGVRLGIPLSGVQANVAYDAMVDLIRAAMIEQVSAESAPQQSATPRLRP